MTKVNKSFTLDMNVADKIVKYSEERGMTQSRFVNEVLGGFFKERDISSIQERISKEDILQFIGDGRTLGEIADLTMTEDTHALKRYIRKVLREKLEI